jgi:hypothetical protein
LTALPLAGLIPADIDIFGPIPPPSGVLRLALLVGQSGGHGFAGHFASDALPQRAAAAFLPASFITGWYACLP